MVPKNRWNRYQQAKLKKFTVYTKLTNLDDVKPDVRCRFGRRWKNGPGPSEKHDRQWSAQHPVVGGYPSTAWTDGGTDKKAQTDGRN